jgi:hypothetical protein
MAVALLQIERAISRLYDINIEHILGVVSKAVLRHIKNRTTTVPLSFLIASWFAGMKSATTMAAGNSLQVDDPFFGDSALGVTILLPKNPVGSNLWWLSHRNYTNKLHHHLLAWRALA